MEYQEFRIVSVQNLTVFFLDCLLLCFFIFIICSKNCLIFVCCVPVLFDAVKFFGILSSLSLRAGMAWKSSGLNNTNLVENLESLFHCLFCLLLVIWHICAHKVFISVRVSSVCSVIFTSYFYPMQCMESLKTQGLQLQWKL